jgi:pyruvate dehydrogenase E2 component (dihydrolipoamide acetyltransferase)
MVIKACAMALKNILSQWKEEAITINHHVNIGVAVAVEDGLVVPVFTDAMSLSQIGNVRDLAGRAKTKNYYLQKWKEVRLQFLT